MTNLSSNLFINKIEILLLCFLSIGFFQELIAREYKGFLKVDLEGVHSSNLFIRSEFSLLSQSENDFAFIVSTGNEAGPSKTYLLTLVVNEKTDEVIDVSFILNKKNISKNCSSTYTPILIHKDKAILNTNNKYTINLDSELSIAITLDIDKIFTSEEIIKRFGDKTNY